MLQQIINKNSQQKMLDKINSKITILHKQMKQTIQLIDHKALLIQNVLISHTDFFINPQTQVNLETKERIYIKQSQGNVSSQTKLFSQHLVLFEYLFQNKIQQIAKKFKYINFQLQKYFDQIIATYQTFIKDTQLIINTIYGLEQINKNQKYAQKLISQLKKQQITKQYGNNLQSEKVLLNKLFQSYNLNSHLNGFSSASISSSYGNMQIIGPHSVRDKNQHQIKKIQTNLQKQIQKYQFLLQQIKKQNKISQIKKKQYHQTQEKLACLKRKYLDLINLKYKCFYNKIIFFHKFQNTQTRNVNQLNSNNIFDNKIQFKIQANGFTNSLNEENKTQDGMRQSKQNLQHEDKFKYGDQIYDKYFQFGLFDPLFSTINQKCIFQNIQFNDKKSLSTKIGEKDELNFEHCSQVVRESRFSVKILNLQSQFYISSQHQAKLIKINSQWQYFGCRLIQRPHNFYNKNQSVSFNQKYQKPNKKQFVQLYGLIAIKGAKKQNSKNDNKSKAQIRNLNKENNIVQTDNLQKQSQKEYKEQIFLYLQLPPKLKNKILKPFFEFKGFSCKIHIKNE